MKTKIKLIDLAADRAFLASSTSLGHLGGQLQLLALEHLGEGEAAGELVENGRSKGAEGGSRRRREEGSVRRGKASRICRILE